MNKRQEASMKVEDSATATHCHEPEGLACKTLEEVDEPIDSRLDSLSRPSSDKLDLTLTRQLSDLVQSVASQRQSGDSTEKAKLEEPIYVDFKEGDKRNPANFTNTQKWITTFIACYATLLASTVATTYPMGFPSMMMRDLNCTNLQAITGLSVYTLGFGIVPLVTASFSEEFGRKPLYVVSSFIFLIIFAMIGLAKNIQTVIVGRFLQGAAGSTGSTMVGGTIADIWSPKDRGIPMALFSLAAIGGAGLGPLMSGWIEVNPHLGWRWIQWIQMMYTGIYFILSFFMQETRSGVLLTRLAKKIRKETGDKRYRARIEDERASLWTLIRISCTRPLYLTLTEPIVTAFSLWVGFAWGVTFSFIDVVPLIFQTLHNFNTGLQGTTFVSMIIGSLLGLVTSYGQDALYRKNFAKRGPEARLYAACIAGVMLPAGLFIFAWCSFPQVNWIGPNIGMVCFMWAIYIIYQAVFAYMSDCYGTWASSASAGQSLARNLVATAFPLFSTQMFERLTFKWAGTLFACIAVLMIPIPYVLFFWGPVIRKRSKVASRLLQV
ncbi:MFS polyamine transporter [Amanita rubescens]|nr:MFS polyamine transporter [Amanita rubescens]